MSKSLTKDKSHVDASREIELALNKPVQRRAALHRKRPFRTRPDNALTIATYSRLEEYMGAFAKGHLNLVILVGQAGLAKTRTVKAVLGRETCWIEGNATPFGMYVKLFRHRDQFVVIDDVDSLYADRSGIRLLKCLCQTEAEKQVAWHSDARTLERHKIPREFVTQSRVVIITNDWKTLNRNVAALQDRGHVIVFEPSPAEIHRKVREWFRDDEVYEWFGQNLGRICQPSMRLYIRALELKRAGMLWTEVLVHEPENPRARLASELLSNQIYGRTEERVSAFVARGGGCRATFFNYKRKLK